MMPSLSSLINISLSQDVYIASGCSQALDLAITLLGNPGDNLLMPRPGFPLYETLARYQGVDVKHYKLLVRKTIENIHLPNLLLSHR